MAWTEPRTWVLGEQTTAALMNTHLRDNLNSLGRDVYLPRVVGTSGPLGERWYPAGYDFWNTGEGLGNGASIGTDQLHAVPFYSPRGRIVDGICFQVTVAGGAGSVGRCGLYQATSESNIYPGALVLDGGEKTCTTATVKSTTGLAITLEPDLLYWAVLLTGVSAPQVQRLNVQSMVMGVVTSLASVPDTNLNVAQTYGALPAIFPAGATFQQLAGVPLIAVRYSA